MPQVCPNGCGDLQPHSSPSGLLWTCPVCHGRAVTMPVLRQITTPDTARSIWRQLSEQTPACQRPCPVCRKPMRSLIETNAGVALEIDACRSCHLFWFDPHELDQVPTDHPQRLRPEPLLPPELREKLALAKIDHIRRQANRDDEGHE